MTVNVITGFTIVGVGLYLNISEDALLGISAGSVLGTVITPDYDFDKNLPKHMIGKIPIVGWAWNLYWKPYAKVVKHRSFWSHGLIISTWLRALYLYAGFVVALMLFSPATDPFYIFFNGVFWLCLMLAWCVQDTTHLVLDSKLFRIFKRR